MCCGGCAKCLGFTLIPLTVLCTIANILLFFPGGTVQETDGISDEVLYSGGILGSGVLMVFPILVFAGLKNNDCCGCCGNEGCGKRFAMFTSVIFAALGVVGAGYCFIISAVALNRGPKCLITNPTNSSKTWSYPFVEGDYLSDHDLWKLCEAPESLVPWNLTLFSLLLIMSGAQMVLCAIQAVNGLLGTICGDCTCCGCCGGNGAV
ncbi:transmembrane 4 L6 family member 4 [Anolis sagrei]|uniref:transmembrane 4 L6 family member 4 n=1 Tax=Anolis sagrei TaxID=38937 RepID=UPI0035223C65